MSKSRTKSPKSASISTNNNQKDSKAARSGRFLGVARREGGRDLFPSFIRDGLEYSVGDTVHLWAGDGETPFVAQIVSLYQDAHSEVPYTTVRWFFRPKDISPDAVLRVNEDEMDHVMANTDQVQSSRTKAQGRSKGKGRGMKSNKGHSGSTTGTKQPLYPEHYLYLSRDFDENPVDTIEEKCVVTHRDDIGEALGRYLESPNHYYYEYLYDSNTASVIPANPGMFGSSAQQLPANNSIADNNANGDDYYGDLDQDEKVPSSKRTSARLSSSSSSSTPSTPPKSAAKATASTSSSKKRSSSSNKLSENSMTISLDNGSSNNNSDSSDGTTTQTRYVDCRMTHKDERELNQIPSSSRNDTTGEVVSSSSVTTSNRTGSKRQKLVHSGDIEIEIPLTPTKSPGNSANFSTSTAVASDMPPSSPNAAQSTPASAKTPSGDQRPKSRGTSTPTVSTAGTLTPPNPKRRLTLREFCGVTVHIDTARSSKKHRASTNNKHSRSGSSNSSGSGSGSTKPVKKLFLTDGTNPGSTYWVGVEDSNGFCGDVVVRGELYSVGDTVYWRGRDGQNRIGTIVSMFERDGVKKMFQKRWFRGCDSDIDIGGAQYGAQETFANFENIVSLINIDNIMGRCTILHTSEIPDLTAYTKENEHHLYYNRYFNPTTKKITKSAPKTNSLQQQQEASPPAPLSPSLEEQGDTEAPLSQSTQSELPALTPLFSPPKKSDSNSTSLRNSDGSQRMRPSSGKTKPLSSSQQSTSPTLPSISYELHSSMNDDSMDLGGSWDSSQWSQSQSQSFSQGMVSDPYVPLPLPPPNVSGSDKKSRLPPPQTIHYTIPKLANIEQYEQQIASAPSTQLLVIFVDAPYIMPMRRLAPWLEQLHQRSDGSFRLFRVNVDESPELGKHLNITHVTMFRFILDSKCIHEVQSANATLIYNIIAEHKGVSALPTNNNPVTESSNRSQQNSAEV